MGEKSCINVDGSPIQIDPQLLFQRLTVAAKGLFEDPVEIFKYELCSSPSSLFDSTGLPRVAQKAALAETIWNLGSCGVEDLPSDADVLFVLDGGSLLQKIPWNIGDSYAVNCNPYVEFVKRKYANPVVVFDGYSNQPSTKDVAHIRRTEGITSTKVEFTEGMPCRVKKEIFLCNAENKQCFINMLSGKLQENGCTTVHAEEDADFLIVKTAVGCAEKRNVVLIGEDTDLLVLLCYHAGSQPHNIFFTSDCKRSFGKQVKIWDIQNTRTTIGEYVCNLLPALHALTGCDTTSRIFGIGKGAALKKLRLSATFRGHLAVFLNTASNSDSVTKAGEELLTALYGGQALETLDFLRLRTFTSKTSTGNTYIKVNTLLPTSNAARYHSMRTFIQCQCWIGEGDRQLASDWGWYISGGKRLPVKCDLVPAPEQLLKLSNVTANLTVIRSGALEGKMDWSVHLVAVNAGARVAVIQHH